MKSFLQSKYFLTTFLIVLFFINLIQGYTTELIADEAYYWVYSNFLDWGYFDHPPMVAVWISISKLFFSSGELSVRFFSTITLSINFYLVWLLIQHPKKKEYAWLFVLTVLSTALFNVYGFITVPDTPLMLFVALFLIGYQKYLQEKSWLGYFLIAIGMAGMMYSKYQAALVIIFVLASNLKLLTDYKLWITAIVALILFSPHLYWQYANDFPSFKYHLVERKQNVTYRFRHTYMHLVNMIAIIGFTFPIVYKALYKNLKNQELFQRALNFIAIGFVGFFLATTFFKGSVQAQWIVPISIPLIIITFNYLIKNPKTQKLFIRLATITIIIATFIRFALANDGLLPKQLEMHGNEKWVSTLEKKLGNKQPLFLNSYQNTSVYWFYSGRRPYQYNSWGSRKNQYDLLAYNKDFCTDSIIQIGANRHDIPTDSLIRRNREQILLLDLNDKFLKFNNSIVSFTETPSLKQNSLNTLKISIKNSNTNFNINTIDFKVVLRNKKQRKMVEAKINNGNLVFHLPELDFSPKQIQIIGKTNPKTKYFRLSSIEKCNLE